MQSVVGSAASLRVPGSHFQGPGYQGSVSQGPRMPGPRVPDFRGPGARVPGFRVSRSRVAESRVSGPDFRLCRKESKIYSKLVLFCKKEKTTKNNSNK